MFKKMLVIASLGILSVSAYAVDRNQVQKSFELKDGSVVYVFKDGKMGMEDKLGRPAYMKSGEIMEMKDGKKIIMTGNEIVRVEGMLHEGHKN